jgi:diguanylate cyclase (GGDEF)-like protein
MLKASMRLEQQVQTVQEQVDELEARNDALAEQATTDGLTGLRNRRSFDETLESELSRARDFGSGLGLIIIDLDHFKSVNDDYGHQTGDELLRAAAGAIGANAEGAIACRYGGEEFALICPTDDETQLTARAEAIRSAVGQIELSTESGPLRRTASLGGCWAGGEALGRTSRELIESADQELYRAKEDGRDRCYVVSLK